MYLFMTYEYESCNARLQFERRKYRPFPHLISYNYRSFAKTKRSQQF